MNTKEKMQAALGGFILWAACFFYTWGTFMADMKYTLREPSREHVGFVTGASMTGPVGVVVAALITNFNHHGWIIWDTDTYVEYHPKK